MSSLLKLLTQYGKQSQLHEYQQMIDDGETTIFEIREWEEAQADRDYHWGCESSQSY